jgi:hypothetical protein
VTKSASLFRSSHTRCLGVLFGSTSVSLPKLSSGHTPLRTEITFPDLLMNVQLVYRLTPKFASRSCKGKSKLTLLISTHDILTTTRHLTPNPSCSYGPHRIALPSHSPIYFIPLPPSSSTFSFLRALHPLPIFRQRIELDAPHFRGARGMLPGVDHYHHRLVDLRREMGIQVLAGTGDLVHRNRVARNLARVTHDN